MTRGLAARRASSVALRRRSTEPAAGRPEIDTAALAGSVEAAQVVLGLGVVLLCQLPGEGAGCHPPLLVECVLKLLVAKASGLEGMLFPGGWVDFRLGLGSLDRRRRPAVAPAGSRRSDRSARCR